MKTSALKYPVALAGTGASGSDLLDRAVKSGRIDPILAGTVIARGKDSAEPVRALRSV